MTGNLYLLDAQRLIDRTGVSAGGSIYFYHTGTSVLAPIYTDINLTSPAANPVVSDSSGALPEVFLDPSVTYRRYIVYADGSTDNADPLEQTGFGALTEPDGAALVGFLQAGTGAVARSVQDKARDIINALDFGIPSDGTSDAYPALSEAIAAARVGQTIFIPYPSSGYYYLSADPLGYRTQDRSITIEIENGTKFIGPGADQVNSFNHLSTNGYLFAEGVNLQYYGDSGGHYPGGGAIKFNLEYLNDDASDYPLALTGTLTNGSAVVSGVSAATIAKLRPGMLVTCTASGFPAIQNGGNGGTTVYVWSIDRVNNSFTMAQLIGSPPSLADYSWAGSTQSASFTIQYITNPVAQYIGMDSGNNPSPYVTHCAQNIGVIARSGVTGYYEGTEIDVQNYSGGTAKTCGMFILTDGNADGTWGVRVGASNHRWQTGAIIANSSLGLEINAADAGIVIDDQYWDAGAGSSITTGVGIKTYYTPRTPANEVMNVTQMRDGAAILMLSRKTDTSPSGYGRFLSCFNAAGTNELFIVGIDGSITSYAASNCNGSTTSSGGIATNGLTLRGGTNLQLGQTAQTATKTATGKYITLYDSAGNPVYIPTFA